MAVGSLLTLQACLVWLEYPHSEKLPLKAQDWGLIMSAAPKQVWMECPLWVRSDSVSSSSVNVIFLLKALTYSIGIKLLLLSNLKWTHPRAPLPGGHRVQTGRPTLFPERLVPGRHRVSLATDILSSDQWHRELDTWLKKDSFNKIPIPHGKTWW